jgi:anti-sigma regulatory factor (Ser/Thr protein kinase)
MTTDPRLKASLLLDVPFGVSDLVSLRPAVAAHASEAGMDNHQLNVLVFIAYELATNAVHHAGGHGRLRLWRNETDLLCEVSDEGQGLPQEMKTPVQPPLGATKGRGLWLVYTFADAFSVSANDGDASGTTIVATLRLSKQD